MNVSPTTDGGGRPLLEVEDLHTYRGHSYVLQGVSMQVPEGCCTTLLGRNGMGKTTLMRSLMGLSPPRSGSIRLSGRDIAGLAPYKVAQLGMALVPQGRRIFPSLSVEENLVLAMRDGGRKEAGAARWTVARVYELFPQLHGRRSNRGNQLSGGEQQMLAIGRALLTNPRLLLMDEPSEGLAPVIVARVGEAIAALREERMTILLVEQNYRLGVDSADHVYVLSNGAVVWEGEPGELDDAEDVRYTYLGV